MIGSPYIGDRVGPAASFMCGLDAKLKEACFSFLVQMHIKSCRNSQPHESDSR